MKREETLQEVERKSAKEEEIPMEGSGIEFQENQEEFFATGGEKQVPSMDDDLWHIQPISLY